MSPEPNLGGALTVLDIDGEFLNDGELPHLSLVERGLITGKIVDKKLEFNKWRDVINMLYGESSNANALYDGDRGELRDRIVKAAKRDFDYFGLDKRTLEAMKKAGESGLLFRLATEIPELRSEDFQLLRGRIDPSFFRDSNNGAERKKLIHQVAADKYLKAQDYISAFISFGKAGDHKRIGEMFEFAMIPGNVYSPRELLEEIALSDPSLKDERLKRIVSSAMPEDNESKDNESGDSESRVELINPLEAFQLYRRHGVSLSAEEESTLIRLVAKDLSRYEFGDELKNEDKIKLLWAKEHATDEPRLAYSFFAEQEYNGKEVVSAVLAGLGLNKYDDGKADRFLTPSQVSEADLRKVYGSAPFDVKVRIASHLKQPDELQELSRQAEKEGKLDDAYRLWVSAEGGFDGDYIDGVRTALIEGFMGEDNHWGVGIINRSDKKGMREAYDFLMQTGEGRRKYNLECAYKTALELDDDNRIQRAREEMVAVGPLWAIDQFTRSSRKDETGLEYAIGSVADRYGVEPDELDRLYKKYVSEMEVRFS